MTDDTARWALPMLAAGQAQKEITVNEALARLDLLAQAGVMAVGVTVPPANPQPGDAWVVGDAPGGAWTGQAQALAGWTADGWRFVSPREGMAVWNAADGSVAAFVGGTWRRGELSGSTLRIGGVPVVGAQQPAIASPAGGATVDAEARAALAALLAAARAHGLIAS